MGFAYPSLQGIPLVIHDPDDDLSSVTGGLLDIRTLAEKYANTYMPEVLDFHFSQSGRLGLWTSLSSMKFAIIQTNILPPDGIVDQLERAQFLNTMQEALL